MSLLVVPSDTSAAGGDVPDASYKLLAGNYLRKQLRKLRKHVARVPDREDIEDVHQARVASRRLRAALKLFDDCFSGGEVKRWRKQLRKLAKSLGKARDLDVQIEWVASVADGLDKCRERPGVRRLVLRLRQQRDAVQPEVVRGCERFAEKRALVEMRSAVKDLVRAGRGAPAGSAYVFASAGQHIGERLHDLMDLAGGLADPDAAETHHDMRIAAKRIRYTMESCSAGYAGALDEPIAVAKQLQGELGDVHDCDVWIEQLDDFRETELARTRGYCGHTRPFGRIAPGIEYLRDLRRHQRAETFERACTAWRQATEAGVWRRLDGTLRARVSLPGPEEGEGNPG